MPERTDCRADCESLQCISGRLGIRGLSLRGSDVWSLRTLHTFLFVRRVSV